jgi:glycosyltransferase involved in cell wall biosynthesis
MKLQRPSLSVTVITRNEEENLPRFFESLRDWADEVVVVDSASTDRTVAIAQQNGARVVQNEFVGYGHQKNFAQNLATHSWVLNLDADECVTPALKEEVDRFLIEQSLLPSPKYPLAAVPRKTAYLGRWILHGGWYPNYLVRLARKDFARWTEPAVHEALEPLPGKRVQAHTLKNPILHYTFKNITDQILTNLKYSRRGYEDLVRAGKKPSLLRLVLKPIGKFLETYIIKQGFRDGIPGFIISVNAAHSMFLRQAYFFETDLPPHRRGGEP